MSATWRQTVGDELMRLIEAKRGVLSIQEFTALALAQLCGGVPALQPPTAPPAPTPPHTPTTREMLSFD